MDKKDILLHLFLFISLYLRLKKTKEKSQKDKKKKRKKEKKTETKRKKTDRLIKDRQTVKRDHRVIFFASLYTIKKNEMGDIFLSGQNQCHRK